MEHIKQPPNHFIFCSDDQKEESRKKEVGEKNEFNGLNKCHLSFRIEPIPKGQENWLPEAAIYASMDIRKYFNQCV